jgi:hypothetical protein
MLTKPPRHDAYRSWVHGKQDPIYRPFYGCCNAGRAHFVRTPSPKPRRSALTLPREGGEKEEGLAISHRHAVVTEPAVQYP